MAIVVDSSQWTGEPAATPLVWGVFASEAARDSALAHLRSHGARGHGEQLDEVADNEGVSPPDDNPLEADQRTLRQGAVGMAMAGTAMAAAGVVIASGGALLPAVAAAAAAGAVSGTVGEAIGHAASPEAPRAALPPVDAPVIGLIADSEEARARAATLLREAGAVRVMEG